MAEFWRDLRYGWRSLTKSPQFTAAALLTLAVGIGASASIYSVVQAVLLRPLPYQDPSRLVRVAGTNPQNKLSPASVPEFYDWREQSESFQSLAAYHRWTLNVTGQGEVERVTSAVLSANLFGLLGVQPQLGRAFELDGPTIEPLVVLAHGIWQRRYGGSAEAVGKTVILDGESHQIIGVMPEGFEYPAGAEMWQALSYGPNTVPRGVQFLEVLGRLKEGASLEEARQEMDAVAARLEQQYPEHHAQRGIRLTPLREQMVGHLSGQFLYLQLAVILVLAIACFNVANLQLSRASARQGEVAVRMALGAGRSRLVRHFLAESLLLAGAAGIAGLLISYWGVRFVVRFGPRSIPRLDETSIDWGVLAFILAAVLISGIAVGLAPALHFSSRDLNQSLKAGGRSRIGAPGARSLFVFLEVAVALVLLVGAGLLIESFVRLGRVSPGFNPRNLLTMHLALPPNRYPESTHTVAFFDQLMERIESLPSVESATAAFTLPLQPGMRVSDGFIIDDQPQGQGETQKNAFLRPVRPSYFRTMGIPVLQGRAFTDQDREGFPGVVVINQELADRFFADSDPVGRSLTAGVSLGEPGNQPSASREIVGVVGNVKHSKLQDDPVPEIYFPSTQGAWRMMNLAVRSSGNAASLAKPVAGEVQAIDPDLPVSKVSTMERSLSRAVAQPRFNMWVLTLFAAIALILAAVGIYGTISYSVYQRTSEIGLRMALGARKQDVLRLVAVQGMFAATAGIGAGVAASLLLSSLLAGLIFGVSAYDPATYLLVCAVLAVVSMAANYFPARRAMRLDPVEVLRYE